MKHLKKFNENVSIFDSNWVKMLPKKLTIVTQNGEFTLDVKSLEPEDDGYSGIYNLMNCICISYGQNTLERENGDPTADGEPDNLQFDITIVKDNKGFESNPKNSLRLNIDLTYGDSMMYAFTIDYPNKVNVHHYNGKDSLYDAGTFFGFTDESLQELVTFFNRFGFTTTVDDFKFIDDDPDSYDYEHPTEKYLKDPGTKGNKLIPMIMDDDMKSRVDDIKGGDKIIRYDEFNKFFESKFEDDIKIDLVHLIDEGFIVNVDGVYNSLSDYSNKENSSEYTIRVWLPINKNETEYSYEDSADFNWSDIEDEIIRMIGYIYENNKINYLYTIASRGQDGYGFKRTEWDVSHLIEGKINPGSIKCFVINVKPLEK